MSDTPAGRATLALVAMNEANKHDGQPRKVLLHADPSAPKQYCVFGCVGLNRFVPRKLAELNYV